MPVCRIMKESNYTRVSNHYLRDNSLSFKAKGLLTLMLSLPEDWDYTIAGLAQFTADGRVSIASTIRELEERGYVRRTQTRGENGAFAQNEYWIYEVPQTENTPCAENVEAVEYAAEMTETVESDGTEPMADIESAAENENVLPVLHPSLPIPLTEIPSTDIMPTENQAQQIKNYKRLKNKV